MAQTVVSGLVIYTHIYTPLKAGKQIKLLGQRAMNFPSLPVSL